MSHSLRAALIEAELALANWQKYNANKGDEVVYQAEKMASSISAILQITRGSSLFNHLDVVLLPSAEDGGRDA